jgi:hypothetical protein
VTTRPHGLSRSKNGPDEHGTPGKGCRCGICGQANRDYQDRRARLMAYGQWEVLTDATGTRRRIQALMRCGWSLGLLSARLGQSRQVLRAKLRDRGRVTPATAAAVRRLYDDLWDRPPPEGTRFERRAATMARRHAAERGWPPPLGWADDEIDDPEASPADGWERGNDEKREYGTLTAEALELAGFGLDDRQIAERLGVSAGTLSVTLARARGKRAPAVQAPSGSAAVAAAIREARVRAGLTQRRLAAVVDVTEQCVQMWERAARAPGPEKWVQLELTLGPLGIVREAISEPAAEKAGDERAA